MRQSTGNRVFASAVGAGAALMLAFLAFPLLALVFTAGTEAFAESLKDALVAPALALSLVTTLCSLALVLLLGTPLAFVLARGRGHAVRLLELTAQLPIVVPPAVGGLSLLLTFGRRGLLGPVLELFGVRLSLTTAAVVLAQVFVSAPFFIQAATAAFRGLDESYVHVARSLGASRARVFFQIILPLCAPGLVSGAAMAWARALGEFGATLMFAGNLTGRTQTLPLAIYSALETDVRTAQAVAVLLIAAALALLGVVRGAEGWRNAAAARRA